MKRTLFLCCGLFSVLFAGLRAQSTVPTVSAAPAAQNLTVGAPAAEVDLTTVFAVPNLTGQIVQFNTVLGKFNVELLASAAPNHVANFLGYVNSGEYNNTFFHRVVALETGVAHSILQGGGYRSVSGVPSINRGAPVNLEYNLPNTRGTLAAARTNVLNSATSEWFFNTRDNSTILGPTNNSGYSVFGRVIGTGMTLVDTISSYPQYNIGGGFTNTPLRDVTPTQTELLLANLITLTSTAVVPVFPSATGQASVVSFTVSSNQTNVASATVVGGRTLAINPVGAGSATLTLTATDTNGNTASTTLAVTAVPPTVPDRRDILTIGTPFSLPLALSGYRTWTTPQILPSWLSLSASTGTLTGTPTADTPAFTFLLNALDANSNVFTQNVTLLFQAPASPNFTFSSADFAEAVTGRTLAGLSFTSATAFTDTTELVGSPYRTGTWTYSSPAANQARLILTYPSATPVSREGINLYHRGALATDAIRYDLDNSDVASGHQITSADFRTSFVPRDLAASVVASRNVGITWRDETWADGYNVYRTTSATPPAASATPLNGNTPLTSASYTDVAPSRGSALTYWVTAVRSDQKTTPLAPASTTITVPDVPLVLEQPTTLLAADKTTLVINITSLGTGLTYQWSFAGKDIKGATAEDLTLKVSTKSAGTYTLKITDNTGDTAQALVVLRVAVVPKITAEPAKSVSLALGGSTTLSVTATGESLSYQWFRNGNALDGKTASTLALTNATADTSGTYTVRVSNIAGAVTTKGTAVTVLAPPSVGAITGPSTVATGGAFTLGVTASGPGKLTYQWRLEGREIPKATGSTYAVKKATSANAGTYTVSVTNSVGTTTSEPRVLAVSP